VSADLEQIDCISRGDDALPVMEWVGVWPGTVVSTADPDRRGRVRVRVPQVYGDPESTTEFIPDDRLPWAEPSFPAHDYHAGFERGDGVMVMFYGGSASCPIWIGQFLGQGDAPPEFLSSYGPDGPQARVVKTANGHTVEMRWVEGDSRITVRTEQGQTVELRDTDGSINVTATGDINVNSGGNTNVVGALQGNYTFNNYSLSTVASILLTAATTLTMTATGLLSITGAGLVLATSGAAILLGSVAGSKQAVVLASFLAKYDAHTHPDPVSGSTGTPSVTSAPTDLSQNVLVD